MKKILVMFFFACLHQTPYAQNLLVNPGAEALPRGTGWTIVNQGALACEFAPTTNFLNWTMKPNGTANYPFDHTIGANGGTVFFAGCDNWLTGPFELYQVVDVSADAANIDFGGQLYTFGGYMQTPVIDQTDEGRFIVDYLSATNTVLAVGYTTAWQSFTGGSGTEWKYYEDTRTAPMGTRKIRVRLQAKLYFNRTAVNVYFDDLSVTKPTIVPLNLLSFSGELINRKAELEWGFATEPACSKIELQIAGASMDWHSLETFSCNRNPFHYEHPFGMNDSHNNFRLKITEVDGRISFSKIIRLNAPKTTAISLFPNPAKDNFKIQGATRVSNIRILNTGGQLIKECRNISPAATIDVSALAPGIYIVHIINNNTVLAQKLLILN